MGRKIPGRKHRGVKDPLKQLAFRNEQLKDKINAPPKNIDHQEMPKSVLEMNRLRELVKQGKFNNKLKKKGGRRGKGLLDTGMLGGDGPQLPGMRQVDKPLPRLVQMPGESIDHFLYRVDTATQEIINETKLENQFRVEVERGDDGKVLNVAKSNKPVEVDEADEEAPQKVPRKPKKKAKKRVEENPKLTRRKRQKLKKQAKLNEMEADRNEKKMDKVKFGEVAHRPPTFTARPRGTTQVNKPGVKNLLLKNYLSSKHADESKLIKKKPQVSMAKKQMLEKQRQDVVAAYRALKASKKK